MPHSTRATTGRGTTVATEVGQLLMSLDGVTFVPIKPVVSPRVGWLSNAKGDLLVEGWFA